MLVSIFKGYYKALFTKQAQFEVITTTTTISGTLTLVNQLIWQKLINQALSKGNKR
jgi:hypothetical protein